MRSGAAAPFREEWADRRNATGIPLREKEARKNWRMGFVRLGSGR